MVYAQNSIEMITNKMISFIVKGYIEINGERMVLLSRREAQEICLNHLKETLSPGMVIKVKVTHLEHFGAFVDLGCGIVSMIPIDRISVSRIRHPDHRFYCGMSIRAIVMGIDYDQDRFLLSHKELLGTWKENVANFSVGQTVGGIIRSVENYGIFVELTPNLAGLAELTDRIEVDHYVGVYIKSIIPEKMKVKLAIVDVGDPISKPTPFSYFYDKDYMARWTYSPEESLRLIEENFE